MPQNGGEEKGKSFQLNVFRHFYFQTLFAESSSNNDLVDSAETLRDNFDATNPQSVVEFSKSMNDFTQDFMREIWNEGDNIAFSPFSLHSVIGLLLAGVTQGSETQRELLSKSNSKIR